MFKNFIRVGSANIKTKLLNVLENKKEIIKYLEFADKANIDLLVFPEMTLSGVSAGDFLKYQNVLKDSIKSISEIKEISKNFDTTFVIGAPIYSNGNIYSGAFTINKGEIINIKINSVIRENNNTFSNIDFDDSIHVEIDNEYYHITNNPIIHYSDNFNIEILFESELYSNIYCTDKKSITLVLGGELSNIIKMNDIKDVLKVKSLLDKSAIAYAGASNYESSSNGIYSSEKYIYENGIMIESGNLFSNGLIYNDINLDELNLSPIYKLPFVEKDIELKRKILKYPYFPEKNNLKLFMRNILEIQSEALVRRLRQIPENKIFIGISGGLDSTLGLIVSSLACHKLGYDSKNIFAITMPGLGTSDRTKSNAINLAKAYNTSFLEIDIKQSVLQHFKDISHDENDYSVTYENAQARERTQVLMDLANKHGGIVLGTGNMSEIALGWSTFNGDHMSMYSVNSGLPKTLLREVVRFVSDNTDNSLLKNTLNDIINTPISPELLPTDDSGNINQKTEENVGPYELHDFFIYHLIRNNSSFENIIFMANKAFSDKYSKDEINMWFNKFIWRFSTQQFKRNISPDSPIILDYSLNSKIGFISPSDIDPKAFN